MAAVAHVDGIALNGTGLANGTVVLLSAGPADFAFSKGGAAPTPVGTTIGSGSDNLVLKISQDAWNGSAQYTVSVDGRQVGGTLTAAALHGAGQDDTITVLGSWATGSHKVTVNFLNDAYDGTPDTDRNLYVDGITHHGTTVPGGAAQMLSADPVDFLFS